MKFSVQVYPVTIFSCMLNLLYCICCLIVLKTRINRTSSTSVPAFTGRRRGVTWSSIDDDVISSQFPVVLLSVAVCCTPVVSHRSCCCSVFESLTSYTSIINTNVIIQLPVLNIVLLLLHFYLYCSVIFKCHFYGVFFSVLVLDICVS